MYRTDFIVKYRDIESELTKQLEQKMAEKVAAQISSAIQANFNFSNINIVTNINGNPILTKTITNANTNSNTNMNMNTIEDLEAILAQVALEIPKETKASATASLEILKETKETKETKLITDTSTTLSEVPSSTSVKEEVKKKRGRKSKKVLAAEALEKQLQAEQDRLEKEIALAKEQALAAQALKKEKQVLEKEQVNYNNDNNDNDEDDDDDLSDYDYTREDIMYICEKLYRDELISVFDAESLEDPKMDAGIKMVFERLIKHDEFSKFLVELSPYVVDNSKAKTEQEFFIYKRNSDYLLFITMFSQQLFYLTHQCICKMLVEGHVGNELLHELKSKLITIFSYCNPSA
jgi:hypothetical protein